MSTEKSLYLAGPMLGLTPEECGDWRKLVAEALAPEITCYSPMRSKGYKLSRPIGDPAHPSGPLTTNQAITTRDRFDCTKKDAVFFNLIGAKKISVGTCIEFGWADMARRPIIVVMELEGNPMDHAIVRGIGNFWVETLEDGIAVARAILLP